jgi:ankyrin repeat protein
MKSQEEVEAYFIDAHTAILLGENATNVLKKSIELCPECASYSDESETLLHIAASRGTPEMIEYIVVSGGDVFLDSIKKEWTPLCWAIAKKRADNVKKLIELGANINSSEPSRSPVLLSIKDHNTEILELLIDAGADIAYQYK